MSFRYSFLLILFLTNFTSIAQKKAKPNVLFIAVDDLKPLLNCYGKTQMHTPNIDRLAKMGTVFMNNYCQQAVCSPSRASIITGQRPDFTRIWDLQTDIRAMNPNIITIPQYFSQNGYSTTGIGKIFHPGTIPDMDNNKSWNIPFQKPEKQDYAAGFDMPLNNFYQLPQNRKMVENIKAKALSLNLTGKQLDQYIDRYRGPAVESADVPDDAYTDGANVNYAVKQISQFAKSNKPFFMPLV